MKTTDLRDLTWENVRKRVRGDMERVWAALQEHGPCTTLELAERSEISPWTVRPRVCDLAHIGLVELVGQKAAPDGFGRSSHHGIYRAVALADAEARWERRRREGAAVQGLLL